MMPGQTLDPEHVYEAEFTNGCELDQARRIIQATNWGSAPAVRRIMDRNPTVTHAELEAARRRTIAKMLRQQMTTSRLLRAASQAAVEFIRAAEGILSLASLPSVKKKSLVDATGRAVRIQGTGDLIMEACGTVLLLGTKIVGTTIPPHLRASAYCQAVHQHLHRAVVRAMIARYGKRGTVRRWDQQWQFAVKNWRQVAASMKTGNNVNSSDILSDIITVEAAVIAALSESPNDNDTPPRDTWPIRTAAGTYTLNELPLSIDSRQDRVIVAIASRPGCAATLKQLRNSGISTPGRTLKGIREQHPSLARFLPRRKKGSPGYRALFHLECGPYAVETNC